MYCGSCGAEREDAARFCKRCGKALEEPSPDAEAQVAEPPPHVENYLVQAILVTIFCCLPFGIVSIVYAAQVNGKIEAGTSRPPSWLPPTRRCGHGSRSAPG